MNKKIIATLAIILVIILALFLINDKITETKILKEKTGTSNIESEEADHIVELTKAREEVLNE